MVLVLIRDCDRQTVAVLLTSHADARSSLTLIPGGEGTIPYKIVLHVDVIMDLQTIL